MLERKVDETNRLLREMLEQGTPATLFIPGKEYWLSWGFGEEQMHTSVKVIAQSGTWLEIEPEKAGLDPLINLAAPWFISARERDREAEERLAAEFQGVDTAKRDAENAAIKRFREESKGVV